MKKILSNISKAKIVHVLSVLFIFSSCIDTFLDLEPENATSDINAVTDEKSAEAALNGAYSRLKSNNYYGGSGYISAIYLAGGDVNWTGSLNYYKDFNTHDYLADNTTVEVSWNAIWQTVNAANQVIDKVSTLNNINKKAKERITGEALFIRALAHFDLARTWANVPVITRATATANDFDGVKQSSQKEVYRMVVEDLKAALPLLPDVTNRTHATQASTNALLARVYLYLEEWDKAEQHATLLIEDPDYELIDYNTFYNEKGSKESILELNYTTSDNNSHWTYWFAPDQGGRHEWGPSEELVDLLNDPDIGGTRKKTVADLSAAETPNYYVGLVYHRTNGDDPAYILRISEQYLIRAEARAKKSDPILEDVLSDLNAVKLRSLVKPSRAATIDTAISDIENERRVEFPFEPHRWFDLVRTNKAGIVLGVTDKNKWIFPIPYNDLQADKDLVQNPGY